MILNIILKRFPLLLLLISFSGCASVHDAGQTNPVSIGPGRSEAVGKGHVFSVFLVGDGGATPPLSSNSVFESLRRDLLNTGKKGAVVFLGDNVYPDGLPPEGDPLRDQSVQRLTTQLWAVEDYEGQILFVPGNHDWQSSGKDGLEWVRRQEVFVEEYLNRGNVYLPDNGEPGPVLRTLHHYSDTSETAKPFRIQLIALDTHWWIHSHEKPVGDDVSGEPEQKERFLEEIEAMANNHPDDEILVAAHHPLFSNGRHGGKFTLKTHLQPPFFGSLYVWYRRFFGLEQDIAGYSELRRGLLNSFKQVDGLIYASGHEHNLQYIPFEADSVKQHYLISGSASKTTHVRKSDGNFHSYNGIGYIKLTYYNNRSKLIEFKNQGGISIHSLIIM